MFLGHFAVALAAKRAAPKTSLGTLALAAQLADLLWPVFLLAGWERVRIVPGITRVSPFDFVSYPVTHSLAAQAGWGIAFALVYFALKRNAKAAGVVGALVVSHWVLDFIVHRPDLSVWPGGEKFGLGLWNSLPATFVTESVLLVLGAAVYLRATPATDRIGSGALWSLLGLLVVLWLGAVFGPPPPNERVLTMSALAIWLTVPWAAWADRHRQVRNMARA